MIDIAQKVFAFAVTLGVLITFHELGHYVVARLAGVKVTRFSIGFGRVVWSRRVGHDATEWALSAVPLGGYVKMVDEREGDVSAADLPRAFNRQSVWKRIAIVAAGPLANLLLAVLLFAGTYMMASGQRACRVTAARLRPRPFDGMVAGCREGGRRRARALVAGPALAAVAHLGRRSCGAVGRTTGRQARHAHAAA